MTDGPKPSETENVRGLLRESAQKQRDLARWIVGGVFATAAGVVTATSISGIGELSLGGDHAVRFAFGLIGLFLGFAGLALLARDALRVMTLDIFSDHDLSAASTRDRSRLSDFWRFAGFDRGYEKQTYLGLSTVKTRLSNSIRADWPRGIDSYEQLYRLGQAARRRSRIDPARNNEKRTELTTNYMSIQLKGGALIASDREGGQISLPSHGSFTIETTDDGKMIACASQALIGYRVNEEDGAVYIEPADIMKGENVWEVSEIERLNAEAYDAAGYLKVEIAFEKLATRLYLNVGFAIVGFLLAAWALNRPASAPEPEEQVQITTQRSDSVTEVVTTTRPRPTLTESPSPSPESP